MFCLSRNKVTRLPPYLAQFPNLEVLQIDRNPIEWPPKSVLERARNLEPGQHMKDWIKSLQTWMETHTSSSKTRDDIMYSEQQDLDNHLYVLHSALAAISYGHPARRAITLGNFQSRKMNLMQGILLMYVRFPWIPTYLCPP